MSIEKLLRRALLTYEDEEVARAVVADAERLGTVERILAGELVLPHTNDATHFHLRNQGIPIGEHGDGPKARALIEGLIARIRALEVAQAAQKVVKE